MDDNQLVSTEKRKRDGGGKTEENAPLPQRQKHDEEKAKEKDGETVTPVDLHHHQAKRTCDDDDDDEDEDEELSEEDYVDDPLFKPGDPEIVAKYWKQLKESRGFDFDVFPGLCLELSCGYINHYCLDYPEKRETVNHLAQVALKDYNTKHKKSFEFDSVVKANAGVVGRGLKFFITFKVKNNLEEVSAAEDSDGYNYALEIFQAVVWQAYGRLAFGRLVPSDRMEKVYDCFPKRY